MPDITQQAAYILWLFTFFAGIYLSAQFLFLRSARRERQLRQIERTRLIAEARLERLLAESHSRLIQPGTLLNATAELGRRYAIDPDASDRLLDALVRHLRAAMNGLAGRAVDPAAQRELRDSHVALCLELGQDRSEEPFETKEALS